MSKLTTKEILYSTIIVNKTIASRVRKELYSRDYESAEKDIEILCSNLCDALCNNFTNEQAIKLLDKFGF